MYVAGRVFGIRRLKNRFVILIFCRPESRFLELIPREESEDSESAIPRLILKRQNTPSDDSTPPKVKYFLSRLEGPPDTCTYIICHPGGPYFKPRAQFFPIQTHQGRQNS